MSLAQARAEIENVLAHYAWTYHMDELDRIGECFTDDPEVTFASGLARGQDAVLAELHRLRAGHRAAGVLPWHVITNVGVHDYDGSRARVTSFFTFVVSVDGGSPRIESIGYYDDVFVATDAGWRIAERRLIERAR